ncbi:PP2C family protein-serine/threonine phosphatase [Pseudomonas donghuensis]|nr:protein phosphatase 2C domain-containing protein [Pseudomonas donghuensis]WKY31027.1 protein phosphatase 2C domain-containing protein [Pseudomonas donghuensis]
MFSFSDKGPRSANQDSYYLNRLDDKLVACVADGVGGNNAGETASQEAISEFVRNITLGDSPTNSLVHAHKHLLELATKEPSLSGMATTFTAIIYDGQRINGVHCGDSRAYILRGKGLKQLTKDHTEIAKLVAEGKISKEDAALYPRKNVLASALGTHKPLISQNFTFDIEPKDRLLIISDGIYADLSKKTICTLSIENNNLEKFCLSVINEVQRATPKDNYTLIGIEF